MSNRFVCDPSQTIDRSADHESLSSFAPRTVPEAFQRRVDSHGELLAMRVKRTKDESEEWTSWTWKEYQQDAFKCAKSLMSFGFQPHHCINLLAANSPEWFIGAMGAIHAGGLAAGVYITNTPEACQYQL